MRTLLSFALLLGLARPAQAQTITLPEKVVVEQPGLVVLRATALDADDVRWFSVGPGLQSFPSDVVQPKPGTYLGFAMKEGVYKVGVICAKDVNGKAVLSQPVYVTVTVGTPAPPAPPTPPAPPAPADPFFATLQAAWAQEVGPTKAESVLRLAGLYDVAARKTVDDPTLTTAGAFEAKFKAGVDALLAPTDLPKVRPAIGANLKLVLPAPASTPLDAATRALIARHYARIAADLDALK